MDIDAEICIFFLITSKGMILTDLFEFSFIINTWLEFWSESYLCKSIIFPFLHVSKDIPPAPTLKQETGLKNDLISENW